MKRVYHYEVCRPTLEGPAGLGQRINYLRCLMGMSSADLAKKLRCSQSAVRYWEIGQSYPGYWQLLEIARYFKVTLPWLMGQEGASREPQKEKA